MRQMKRSISLLLVITLLITYTGMSTITVHANNEGKYRSYETQANIVFEQEKNGYLLNQNNEQQIKNDKKITVEEVVRGNEHSEHYTQSDDPVILTIVPYQGYEIDFTKTYVESEHEYIYLEGNQIIIEPPDIKETEEGWPQSQKFDGNIYIAFKEKDNKIVLNDNKYTIYYNEGDNPKCIYNQELLKELFDALVDVEQSYSDILKYFEDGNIDIEYVASKPDNPEPSWKWKSIGDALNGSQHEFATEFDIERIRFVSRGEIVTSSDTITIEFKTQQASPTTPIVIKELDNDTLTIRYEKGKFPRVDVNEELQQYLYEQLVDYEASQLHENLDESGVHIQYVANEANLTDILEIWKNIDYVPMDLEQDLHCFSGKSDSSLNAKKEVIRFVNDNDQTEFSKNINIVLEEIEKTIELKDNHYTIQYNANDKEKVNINDEFYQKLYSDLVDIQKSNPVLESEILKSPIAIEFSANYEGVDLSQQNDWQSLDLKPDTEMLQHKFGELDQELIRFVYKDNNHYYSQNVVVSFEKVGKRESSIVLREDREMAIPYTKNSTYLKQFLFESIDFEASDLPEAIINNPTPDYFKLEYQYDLFATLLANELNVPGLESLGINKMWVDVSKPLTVGELIKQDVMLNFLLGRIISPETKALPVVPNVGMTEVRMSYLGNEDYTDTQLTEELRVYKAVGSIQVSSQIVKYGTKISDATVKTRNESFGIEETMKYMTAYVGISGDGQGYFSVMLPKGYEKLEETLQSIFGKEMDIGSILQKSETLKKLFEKYGLTFPSDQILEIINALSQSNKLTIEIGKRPTQVGIYMTAAIVVENNYTTKTGVGMPIDVGMLTIVPTNEDVQLIFKNDTISKITKKEAIALTLDDEFGFGAKATSLDGQTVYNDVTIKTMYIGLVNHKEFKVSDKPFVETGTYKEYAYVVGGNYIVAPVTRQYTVEKEKTVLKFDKPFDNYYSHIFDGKKVNPQAQAYTEDDENIIDGDITYIYERKITSNLYVPILRAPSDIGHYRVHAIYQDHKDYNRSIISQEFEIVKGKVDIQVENIETIYDGQRHTPNVSFNQENVHYTITYFDSHFKPLTHAPKDAGNYMFVVSVLPTATMNGTSKIGTIKIDKAKAILTIEDSTKTYGDKDPQLNYSIKGLYGKDDLSKVTLKRTPGETVGKYKVTAKFIGNKNYDVQIIDGFLTITKAQATIRVKNVKKTYGDKDPKLTYEVEGLKKSFDLGMIYLVREQGEDAGQYTITAYYYENKNYDVALENGTLTIQKAKAMLYIQNTSKIYGQKDPEFKYAVYGMKKKDTLKNVQITRQDNSKDVGIYTLDARYDEDKNYDILVVRGVLTIKPKTVIVKVDKKIKVYGQEDPLLTYKIYGLIKGDEIENLSLKRQEGEDIGFYKIEAQYSKNKNYNIKVVPHRLEIKPKEVIIDIWDATKTYGDEDPKFEFVVDGLENHDQIEDIKLSREIGEDAGEYEIQASYTSNPNYEITVNKGTFTIEPAQISIEVSNAIDGHIESDYGTSVYPEVILSSKFKNIEEGEMDYTLTYYDIEGHIVNDIETAGSYTYLIKVEDTLNYKGASYSGTIDVLPKEIHVYVLDSAKSFGKEDPEFPYAVEGVEFGTDLTNVVEIQREAGEALGKYRLFAVSLSENYRVISHDGTMSILEGDEFYVPGNVPPKEETEQPKGTEVEKEVNSQKAKGSKDVLSVNEKTKNRTKENVADSTKEVKSGIQTDDATEMLYYVLIFSFVSILMLGLVKKR